MNMKPKIPKPHHRKEPLILDCEICGKTFEHWTYTKRTTCGKECQSEKSVERRKKEGTYNGKSTNKTRGKPKKAKSHHRKTPLIVDCKVCKKTFEHWTYAKCSTCDQKCSSILMAKKRKEKGNYTRTEKAIQKGLKVKFGKDYKRRYDKICPICGKEFKVRASQKDRRVTCSKKCMGIWNGNKKRGGTLSLEHRELISKTRIKRGVAKGKKNPNYGKGCHHPTARGNAGYRKDIGHFVRSTPEANYTRILQHEGIKYEYEHKAYPIVRDDGTEQTYTPDFYLVKDNKYIELKGFEKEDSMDKYRCFVEQYPHIEIEMLKTPLSEEWKALKRKYDKVIAWEYTPGVLKQRKKNMKKTGGKASALDGGAHV